MHRVPSRSSYFFYNSLNGTFTFQGNTPDVVLEIDSLSIYSSSSNSSGLSSFGISGAIDYLVVQAIVKTAAASDANEGEFNIDFKYYLWNNKKKTLINAGFCSADETSDSVTVSEWEDIISETVDAIFSETKLMK